MSTPDHMTPAVAQAWRGYLEALDWARQFIFSRDLVERPEVREAANHFLMQAQAAAYGWVMAPRVDYPRFHLGLFEPMVWTFAFPSPDFRTRWAFIDGAQTYRIWGRRGDARFLDLQLMPSIGSMEKDAFRRLPTAAYPLDDMRIEPDGSFEIIASPHPQTGNWIRLDPAQDLMTLFVREAFYDWAQERPSLLRIERVTTTPPRPMRWDDAEMIVHIDQAARFVRYIVEDWGIAGFERTRANQGGAVNTFQPQNAPANSGSNPAASNINMIYELGADEALIIETEVPASRYWGFSIADRFFQLADPVYHQSSLNGHQAAIDRDGRFRAVLTQADPGVPNWLDPVGAAPLGVVQFRQFFQPRALGPPRVMKVAAADVRRHLPPDTPRVTADERTAQLKARSWAALGLYGY